MQQNIDFFGNVHYEYNGHHVSKRPELPSMTLREFELKDWSGMKCHLNNKNCIGPYDFELNTQGCKLFSHCISIIIRAFDVTYADGKEISRVECQSI